MDVNGTEMQSASSETTKDSDITLTSLPEKSKRIYVALYETFCKWKEERKRRSSSEMVLLEYFKELSTTKKCSTLYSNYSMLKTTLNLYENVNIEHYSKLQAFLKQKNRGFKPKKSTVFTPENIIDFMKTAPDIVYLPTKVALVMGVIGGCICDELYQLKISDLQDIGEAYGVTVVNPITTRPRKFFITHPYYELVKRYVSGRHTSKYTITHREILFLQYRKGHFINQRVGINTFRQMGKEIATFLKLPNPKNYSARSIRKASLSIFVDAVGNLTAIPSRNTAAPNRDKKALPENEQFEFKDVQENEDPDADPESDEDGTSDISDSYNIHIDELSSPPDIKPEMQDLEEHLSPNQSNQNGMEYQPAVQTQQHQAAPVAPKSISISSVTSLDTRPKPMEHTCSSSDEFHMFGMCVASQLRNMPLETALLAQSKMQQLITELRLRPLQSAQTGSDNLNFNGLFDENIN